MRTGWLFVLLPARHRERYGDELTELLEASSRPRRDGIDLAGRAIVWNVEELMRRPWFVAAGFVAALSCYLLGWSVASLAGGVSDLPRHWWSSASIAGFALAVGLALIGRARQGSSSRHRS